MKDALDPGSLQRLARICAMFGSDFPGERANAAAMADRIVRGMGYSWETLLQRLTEPASGQPAGRPEPDFADDREAVAYCSAGVRFLGYDELLLLGGFV